MDVELLLGIFPQVLLDGITLGFMYALIALGYTMVYGVLEFINFAHSEIFIFGAFVGVELLLTFKTAGWLDVLPWVVVLVVVLLAGMAASGLLAVLVERTAYRPLRHAPRLIPLISAIGVSFFPQDTIRLAESLWRNAFNLVYPSMDALNHRFELTQTIDVSMKSLVVIVAALLMLWGLHSLVNRTKVGKAIRAVAEDQAAASLMGINVNRMISLTFLIGGAMGGGAGVLFGMQYSLINPYTGFIPGLKAFTAAVLGGIGNIPGAMLGRLLLGILQAFGASYLSLLTGGALRAEYRDIRGRGPRRHHRGGARRAPGPRLCRLLRGRRLFLGHLRVAPGQSDLRRKRLPAVAVVVLRLPPGRRRRGRRSRHSPGPARAEAPRRLPGPRDPRLRRRHPRARQQSRQAHQPDQRSQGHHAHRTTAHLLRPAPAGRRDRPELQRDLPALSLRPRAADRRRHRARQPAAGGLAHRPGLGGDPRGPDGRAGHGRAARAHEAPGLRLRRLLRGGGRRALLGQADLHQPGVLHLHGVHRRARHDHPGRHGLHPRRDPRRRRRHHSEPPGPQGLFPLAQRAPQRGHHDPRLQPRQPAHPARAGQVRAHDLRPHPRAHDDLPAAGHPARAAPHARAPGAGGALR